MKRRIAAMMLVLVMILTITACADERDKLVGTWAGDIDFATVYNRSLGSAEEIQYLTVDSLVFRMELTFTEAGTYTMTVDEDSLHTAMDGLKADLKAGMEQYLTALAAQTDGVSDADEYLALLGVSMDDLIDSVVTQEMIDEMAALMVTEGNFEVDEGRLYMSDSLETPIDHEIYDIYAQDGDYLILAGTNINDSITDLLYPLKFTRVDG